MIRSLRQRTIGLAMLQSHGFSPFRWGDRPTPGTSKADRPLKAPAEQGKNDE
jgi:hypothetical protein